MFLHDRLQISTKRTYTDEGFLIVPATISRTGIYEYQAIEMGLTDREPTATIRVFRPEEEVFSDRSLSSFANKPITDNHPPELISAKNAKEFSVGHAGPEVTKEGDYAKTILHVNDADAIAKIESGKVELSNGYTADIEWGEGISPNGEKYDAIQRNIKGNHIAIVERGRAGSSCRVADTLPTEGDFSIMKVTIDGVDFELTDQAAQAVGKLQTRLIDAEKKALTEAEEAKAKEDEMEEEAAKAKKSEDSLKAELDDAKSKIPTAEALDALVDDRKTLIDSVLKVMPTIEWKGKDANTLRAEVVAANCENVQMDSVTPDYIEARFDMLVDSVGNTNPLDTAIAKQVTDAKGNVVDNRPKSVVAREKMMQDSQDAWKGDNK